MEQFEETLLTIAIAFIIAMGIVFTLFIYKVEAKTVNPEIEIERTYDGPFFVW